MFNAAATLALTPVDLALSLAERRSGGEPLDTLRPMLIVCGPARSGTTLVAQAFITTLPVAYVDNFTSLFPRSPLTARKIFRAKLANEKIEPRSHYGRTARLWAPNDALYFWDRWLGSDRATIASHLSAEQATNMRAFWAAYEASFDAPIVAKANRVVAHMQLVGAAMPHVTFAVMERQPLYLAQSLLQARRHIHGRDDIPYGLADPALAEDDLSPYESVAHQVAFADRLTDAAESSLGPARVWRISYEDFCNDPAPVIMRASQLLGLPSDEGRTRAIAADLAPSATQTLDDEEFGLLREAVTRICSGMTS